MLILIVVITIIFSFNIYNKHRSIEGEVNRSVEMYMADISDSFRRFEYDNVLIEGLYYFNAYASLSENVELYDVSSRLVRYTEKEKFENLQFEDAVYIADFLDLMRSDSPPTSNEVLEFLNFIILTAKE